VLGRLTTNQIEDITRATQRPTAMLNTFSAPRIQEVVLAMFRRFNCTAIDMETLIYFVLREFHVSIETYQHMHNTVKAHVLKNFAIQQGAPLRLTEVSMRRITVCFTIEQHED
jgi:hypothetical protein